VVVEEEDSCLYQWGTKVVVEEEDFCLY